MDDFSPSNAPLSWGAQPAHGDLTQSTQLVLGLAFDRVIATLLDLKEELIGSALEGVRPALIEKIHAAIGRAD